MWRRLTPDGEGVPLDRQEAWTATSSVLPNWASFTLLLGVHPAEPSWEVCAFHTVALVLR